MVYDLADDFCILRTVDESDLSEVLKALQSVLDNIWKFAGCYRQTTELYKSYEMVVELVQKAAARLGPGTQYWWVPPCEPLREGECIVVEGATPEDDGPFKTAKARSAVYKKKKRSSSAATSKKAKKTKRSKSKAASSSSVPFIEEHVVSEGDGKAIAELEDWKARGVNVRSVENVMCYLQLAGALAALSVDFGTDVLRAYITVKGILHDVLRVAVVKGLLLCNLDRGQLKEFYETLVEALDAKRTSRGKFFGVKVRLDQFFESLAVRADDSASHN